MDFDFLLIQKAKNGDREAGEHLVKKYYSAIYQYCILHIHDCHEAEDMTQETFVRFFESLKTYQECGKAKNYLYCIAGNIVRNYYRKRKAMPIAELPEGANNVMKDIEIRMEIEEAVDSLPNELKEVVILFFFQGLRQREIAELMNIKLSLVKYRIGRAKRLLADCLEVKK